MAFSDYEISLASRQTRLALNRTVEWEVNTPDDRRMAMAAISRLVRKNSGTMSEIKAVDREERRLLSDLRTALIVSEAPDRIRSTRDKQETVFIDLKSAVRRKAPQDAVDSRHDQDQVISLPAPEDCAALW